MLLDQRAEPVLAEHRTFRSRGLHNAVGVGEHLVPGPELVFAVTVRKPVNETGRRLGIGQGKGHGAAAAGPGMEGRRMAGVRVGQCGRREVDDAVKCGGEDRLAGFADNGHEPPVDLAQNPARITTQHSSTTPRMRAVSRPALTPWPMTSHIRMPQRVSEIGTRSKKSPPSVVAAI